MDSNSSINPFDVLTNQLNRIESLLVEVREKFLGKDSEAKPIDEDDGIAMAVRVTGYKRKTIYNLVNKRLIPHSKKRHRLRFNEQELREWKMGEKRLTIIENLDSSSS